MVAVYHDFFYRDVVANDVVPSRFFIGVGMAPNTQNIKTERGRDTETENLILA